MNLTVYTTRVDQDGSPMADNKSTMLTTTNNTESAKDVM